MFFVSENKMEEEVQKCFSIRPDFNLNIIIMINRILVEWHNKYEFYIMYPRTHVLDIEPTIMVETMNHQIYELCINNRFNTTYVSEDYSLYASFCKIYSCHKGSLLQAKKDILDFYESVDPKKKLVKYEDWNIQIEYLT